MLAHRRGHEEGVCRDAGREVQLIVLLYDRARCGAFKGKIPIFSLSS